jgi:hypothetical protein
MGLSLSPQRRLYARAEPRQALLPRFSRMFLGVPDAGSTLPLLGFASLGLAALRRKLSR